MSQHIDDTLKLQLRCLTAGPGPRGPGDDFPGLSVGGPSRLFRAADLFVGLLVQFYLQVGNGSGRHPDNIVIQAAILQVLVDVIDAIISFGLLIANDLTKYIGRCWKEFQAYAITVK
jgi:hypothetical protein